MKGKQTCRLQKKTRRLIVMLATTWLVLGSNQVASAQEKDSIQPKTDSVVEIELITCVDELPSYKSGTENMYAFIDRNLQYPQQAIDSGIEGRVFVNFYVDTCGVLEDFRVLRGIGYGCDEAAVEVLNKMPAWRPARIRGRAIRCQYTLPIVFKLPDDAKKK